MNIFVNTSNDINGSAELNSYVEGTLAEAFERYQGAITRIEVYLSDENADKQGSNDKRCLLEARLSHHTPVVVSNHADNIHQAIEGASDKLLRSLETVIGKLNDRTSVADLTEETPSLEE